MSRGQIVKLSNREGGTITSVLSFRSIIIINFIIIITSINIIINIFSL